jgi:hypothetical protein
MIALVEVNVVAPAGNAQAWIWTEVDAGRAPNGDRRGLNVSISHFPPFRGGFRGPRNIPIDCESPGDVFRLLFDDTIVSTFLQETNAYMAVKLEDGVANVPGDLREDRLMFFLLVCC